jgi:hypothetical protein
MTRAPAEAIVDSTTVVGARVTGSMFTCDHCRMPSLGMVLTTSDPRTSIHGLERGQIDDWFAIHEEDIQWLPPKGVRKLYEDVPAHVAAAAGEAHECESIGARRAAVQLARSVVEATAKDKGITRGTLADKIDAMHAAGLIREHVHEAAHEIRYLGNEMAHGDFVEPVSAEDASETLELMAEVLNEVYQSPARVVRVRTARLRREATAAESPPSVVPPPAT